LVFLKYDYLRSVVALLDRFGGQKNVFQNNKARERNRGNGNKDYVT